MLERAEQSLEVKSSSFVASLLRQNINNDNKEPWVGPLDGYNNII